VLADAVNPARELSFLYSDLCGSLHDAVHQWMRGVGCLYFGVSEKEYQHQRTAQLRVEVRSGKECAAIREERVSLREWNALQYERSDAATRPVWIPSKSATGL
jgi:hypothetical protein